MRLARQGESLTAAARKAGTTVPTIKRHFGRYLSRSSNGRLVPSRADRTAVDMRVVTTTGVRVVTTRGSGARSLVGRHFNAVTDFLRTGDTSLLDPFRAKQVGGQTLETDPDVIVEWWRQQQMDFLDIYRPDF